MNPMQAAGDLAGAAPSLSLIGLFLGAHPVVKLVMLGLLGASVWCWAIIWGKARLFARTRREMDAFEDAFWSGRPLEEIYAANAEAPASDTAAVFVAAMREWKRSLEGAGRASAALPARVDRVMDVAIGRESERLSAGLLVLASIGSAAPFIGLFGTVFGIMNSFIAISASKNTSLAVVAPGIAEALFATAIGLVAAIPAVIAYNKLSAEAGKLQGRLETFADEFSAILSRRHDERLALAA